MQSDVFWSSLHPGPQGQTDNSVWSAIPDFAALEINLEFDSQVLLTLTVPDTWNDTAGAWTWFGISVDGSNVAVGLNSMGTANQRVPISVATTVPLVAGAHTVEAVWQVQFGGNSFIGGAGTASLSAQAYANIV